MRLRDGYARDLPFMQQKFDYGARVDGQPVYRGIARVEDADDDTDWIIHYTTYNADGSPDVIKSREGAWSGRVALFA
jgi:hypothetical protein